MFRSHNLVHQGQGRTEKLGDDLRCGVGDRILDRSLQVYEYLTTFLDAFHGGSKVVIKENHIRGFLGHVRARNVHSNPKVRALQSWGIIDAIASPATLY
jgi:hypothetical protein